MNMSVCGQVNMLWYSTNGQTQKHLPFLMLPEANVFYPHHCPPVGIYFLSYSAKDHFANGAILFICFLLDFQPSVPLCSLPCQTLFPCSWESGAI